MNRSKFTAQEAEDGTCSKLKPCKMGMQVSCSVDTEVSEEVAIGGIAEIFGFNVQRPRAAEGMQSDRGAYAARSHSHADIDTAQICGISGSGLSERKECHSGSQDVHGAEEELHGSTFLGAWLLCVNSWCGRGDSSRIYQAARNRRSSS